MPTGDGPTTRATATATAKELSRRAAIKRFGAAGLLLTGFGNLLAACREPAHPDARNVLVVVADDLRADFVQFMPNVQQLIGAQGRVFTEARCNVPLCQPSRVGLLTGQLSKHNGETAVGFGGTNFTDHNRSLARWMWNAGYRCGLFGKYVNAIDGNGGIDAPPCYQAWREYTGETGPYEFSIHEDDRHVAVSGEYQTDYLAREALAFIRTGARPWFCLLTPTQPHAPYLPRADLADEWLDFVWQPVEEPDRSDKPPWIRDLPAFTDADRAAIRAEVIGYLQELTAVDDMVGRVLTGMDPAVLAETVVIFTSDNGVHRGEHGRRKATKAGPYDVCLKVPMVVRGPGFDPGPAVTVPVLALQDVTATALQAAHATATLPHQAGTSLLDLCRDPPAHRDRLLLHEIGSGWERSGDGITTGPDNARGHRKLYRYPSVRRNPWGPFTYEAYDLDTDRHEHTNWADDPARRAERDALEATMLELRWA